MNLPSTKPLYAALMMVGIGSSLLMFGCSGGDSATANNSAVPANQPHSEGDGHNHDDAANNAASNNSANPPASSNEPATNTAASNDAPAAATDAPKVKITRMKPGKGPKAAAGDLLAVKYRGTLTNGKVFDFNDTPDKEPLVFVLKTGNVIQGWHEGFDGAQKDEKLKLEIPYQLAYGEAGSGDMIPPKSTLIFEATVVDLVKKDEDMQVEVKDIKEGSGAAVKADSAVSMKYKAYYPGGKTFEDTIKSNKIETVKLGTGKLVPGLESGLEGMKKGGVRRIKVPPKVGYGEGGRGLVSPNAIVYFEVQMIDVK